MKLFKSIQLKFAVVVYLSITAFALLYHFLILAQVVDYKNAWGGRLESIEQMQVFEMISIGLQITFVAIIWFRVYGDRNRLLHKLSIPLCYLIALVFLLNTFGNMAAIELFERMVFAPLTFVAFVVVSRIAVEPTSEELQV